MTPTYKIPTSHSESLYAVLPMGGTWHFLLRPLFLIDRPYCKHMHMFVHLHLHLHLHVHGSVQVTCRGKCRCIFEDNCIYINISLVHPKFMSVCPLFPVTR